VDASYKDLTQVCSAIRGKTAEKAKQILENAIEEKVAIEFKRFGKGAGHKSSLGGRRGKFPKKECRIMLKLLENAVSNAVTKGLNKEGLQIYQIAAFKQNSYPRYKKHFVDGIILGYGKYATRGDFETARVELVLQEVKSKPKEEKKEKAQKAAKPKKEKVEAAKAEEQKA